MEHGIRHTELGDSDDVEMLEIVMSADFKNSNRLSWYERH